MERKEYSVINNFFYSIKKANMIDRVFVILLVMQGFCWGEIPIIVSYISKKILDLLSRQKDWYDIIIVVSFGIIIMLALDLIQKKIEYSTFLRKMNIKFFLVRKRVEHNISTNYVNLENKDYLDMMDRARVASEEEKDGFSAVYNNIICLSRNILTISITISTVALINPIILILLFMFSVCEYFVLEHTKKENKRKYTDAMTPMWRKLGYLDGITNDFEYAKDIRINSAQSFLKEKSEEVNKKAHIITKNMYKRWIRSETLMALFSMMQNVCIYAWVIWAVIYNNLSVGSVVFYIGITTLLNENIIQLFDVVADLQRVSIEINDYRYIEEIDEMLVSENISNTKIDINNIELEFKNVSFRYPGQKENSISNLNLKINSGTKLAIVGGNGAGKTTLIKLLTRLYEPSEGEILINGKNIKSYPRDLYFKMFSVIFQDKDIFALSLQENVTLSDMTKSNNRKVKKSLNDVGLAYNSKIFQNSLDTQILKIFNKEGIDLSGGQRQKILMARALYKEAPIIILDEPTAALDAISEDKLYKSFARVSNGKMTLFISHRLASTRFCDEIIFMDKGRIVEKGTHNELIKRESRYKEMFETQAQYYIE